MGMETIDTISALTRTKAKQELLLISDPVHKLRAQWGGFLSPALPPLTDGEPSVGGARADQGKMPH